MWFARTMSALTSTEVKTLPLWTPITEPIISGMISMSRRWVLTTSGLSYGPQSFFALRSFFSRCVPLRLMPRASRRRARACTRSICARGGACG